MNQHYCFLLAHDVAKDGSVIFTVDEQVAANMLCEELELNGFKPQIRRRYGRWQWRNGKPHGEPVEYRVHVS